MKSAEVTGSYCSLQRPGNYWRWFEKTSPHFVVAVRGPRFISHKRKLRDAEEPLANSVASGDLRLGASSAPSSGSSRLRQNHAPGCSEASIKILPRDTRDAEFLAEKRGERVAAREWPTADARGPLR